MTAPKIPEEIMGLASEIVDRIAKVHTWKGDCIADVATALLARDQRAAQIARERTFDEFELRQATEYGRGAHAAASDIAAAILTYDKEPS